MASKHVSEVPVLDVGEIEESLSQYISTPVHWIAHNRRTLSTFFSVFVVSSVMYTSS